MSITCYGAEFTVINNVELTDTIFDFADVSKEAQAIIKRDHWLFRSFAWGINPYNGPETIPTGTLTLENAQHYDAHVIAVAMQLVSTIPQSEQFDCSSFGKIQIGPMSVSWRIEIDKAWSDISANEDFDLTVLERKLYITFPESN